jgi:uncharacterized protein YukE
MADDAAALLHRLKDFEKALVRSRRVASEQFSIMQRSVGQLGSAYEGQAAQQFMHRWRRTQETFAEYEDGLHDLIAVLNQRVDALAAAEATDLS